MSASLSTTSAENRSRSDLPLSSAGGDLLDEIDNVFLGYLVDGPGFPRGEQIVPELALGVLGLSEEPALAFAVLYRVMDMVPVTVLGLLALPSFQEAAVLTGAQREQDIAERAARFG